MKRFIVTGHGRSATKWLAFILNKNLHAEVSHEFFKHRRAAEDIGKWFNREKAPVMGMVNGHALHFIPAIIEEADKHKTEVQWATVWRDPVDLVISVWRRWIGGGIYPTDQIDAQTAASKVAVGLEGSLVSFKMFSVKLSYWHMDYYTTDEGVNKMASYLGIPFSPKIRVNIFKGDTIKVISRGGRIKTIPRRKDGVIDAQNPNTPYPEWREDREKITEAFFQYPLIKEVYSKMSTKGWASDE